MAKDTNKITIDVLSANPERFKGDLLAAGMYKDTTKVPERYRALDDATDGEIGRVLKLGDFTGKSLQTAVLYTPSLRGCPRVMLIGLGESKDFKLNTLRQAAGAAVRQAEKLGASRVGLALHATVEGADLERVGQALAEGAIVGRYSFRDFMTQPTGNGKPVGMMRVSLVEPNGRAAGKLKKGVRWGAIVARAQNLAREIANQPGNEINPPVLASEAQRLARRYGLRCRVFNDHQLAAMKMNAILAVGGGSSAKPRLIVLEYRGRRSGRSGRLDLVIVGKAITFDSGGVNLKPTGFLDGMKLDKSGGCAILGILTALAELKLPVHVIGLIPSAENLISGTCWRPDDIIRTYSGRTVEIQNTDAEGRMILCDALAYGAKSNPKVIIDLATLTGACRVALGEVYAGLFGNNDELQARLRESADRSGELLWPLPSGPDYLEQMRSKIADLKNVASREGAACNAAAFLGEFVNGLPWAHLDIAPVAEAKEEKPYRAVGATGFGVRLVLEYLRTL